jgi:GntR family transcriptional regulator / MocR family aminotransferase
MLRPWILEVELMRDSNTAIHAQIADKIIDEIQQGRFEVGMALPGTRELAIKLGVNRKTVVQAYEELIAQGWLITENKRGTFVSSRILSVNNNPKPIKKLDFAFKNKTIIESKAINNKKAESDFINFSDGLADSRLIPLDVLSRAMRHALIRVIRSNKYSHHEPKGELILRQAILHMLNMGRSLHADVENICIVRGQQMGYFLIGRVLVRQNDVIVMEKLCDQLACDAFKSCGASIIPIEQNEQGMDLDALDALCKTTKIRAVFVSPHYQFPTTTSMPMQNRRRLLALADEHDFLIIEDDHDFEFHFSKKPVMPLASLDKPNRVIYVGSLSNVLAPSFRLGFVVASREIIKHFGNEIRIIDRQGNVMTELAVAELLHMGEINRHTLKIAKTYEERRAFTAKLIRSELSDYVDFDMPDGGLALWLKIIPSINMQTLLKDMELEKVRVIAGTTFSLTNEPVTALRLGFATLNNDETALGIKRLKRAFERQTNQLH